MQASSAVAWIAHAVNSSDMYKRFDVKMFDF